jgi:hypothetical protein
VRLPRKGILIRLCIYVPVLAYLSWRAYDRWASERTPTVIQQDELDAKLAPHKRVITLPDGTQQEIVELTPEQAEAILGPLPELDAKDSEAKAK